jgi:hypothetical protein
MRGKTNHEDLKLKSFNWQDKLRPKTKYDLLKTSNNESTTARYIVDP